MSDNTKQETKKPRVRPNEGQRFPFITLSRAIERSRELYSIANTHEVAMSAAVKHWGYGEKSSGGLQTVAALKAFGLIEDTGSNEARKIKLSDSALKIIRDPREISPDRDALIKQAALLPPIHRETIEKYNGLPPSDEAFKAYLLLDKGMKDDTATAFAKEFNATMSFAKFADSAKIAEVVEQCEDEISGNDNFCVPSPSIAPSKQEPTGVRVMAGERIVFTEETQPNEYLRLIASGEINEYLLDALNDFVSRQKRRLGIDGKNSKKES